MSGKAVKGFPGKAGPKRKQSVAEHIKFIKESVAELKRLQEVSEAPGHNKAAKADVSQLSKTMSWESATPAQRDHVLGVGKRVDEGASVKGQRRRQRLLASFQFEDKVNAVAFSPDSAMLAVGLDDCRAVLFDTASKTEMFALDQRGAVLTCSVSTGAPAAACLPVCGLPCPNAPTSLQLPHSNLSSSRRTAPCWHLEEKTARW